MDTIIAIRPATQVPPSLLDHDSITAWLAGTDLGAKHTALAEAYRTSHSRFHRLMRREREIDDRCGEIARLLEEATGRGRVALVQEHGELAIERSALPDNRIRAASDYVDRTNALCRHIQWQAANEHDQHDTTIKAALPERRSLERTMNALPAPDDVQSAMDRFVEIGRQLGPTYERRDVCRVAFQLAESAYIDAPEAARLAAQARTGH